MMNVLARMLLGWWRDLMSVNSWREKDEIIAARKPQTARRLRDWSYLPTSVISLPTCHLSSTELEYTGNNLLINLSSVTCHLQDYPTLVISLPTCHLSSIGLTYIGNLLTNLSPVIYRTKPHFNLL